MPEEPSSGLFTHWVLENPYPLAIAGAAIGVCLLWMSRFGERAAHQRVGLVAILLALAVYVTGALVETAGEEAEVLTEQLVQDAVAGDVDAVLGQFAPNGGLALNSPQNQAFDVDVIADSVRGLADRYSIQSNRITRLRSYTISGDEAVVYFSCSTDAGGGFPYPTSWIAEYERQSDGTLRISRLTWMPTALTKPSLSLLR